MSTPTLGRTISSRAGILLIACAIASLTACSDSDPERAEPWVLVAALGGSPEAGDLYVVDGETGEIRGFVDTSADCEGTPCEIGSIRSSVYDPGSKSLIVGTSGSSFCPGCILQIDLSTFVATVLWDRETLQAAVGEDLYVSAVPGMAMRRDGVIFATLKQGEGGPVALVHFTRTESPTYVGLTGVAADLGRQYDLGNALVFWTDGALYYTTGAGLSTVDPATAVATHVGGLSYDGVEVSQDPDFTKLNSLVLTPAGKLVGILDDDGEAHYLGTLDRGTRTFRSTAFYDGATLEETYGLGNLGGLGVIPERYVAGKVEPLPPPP